MEKGLVIFGIGKIAEVVFYYAKEECGFDVSAFCVDESYKTSDKFNNLPVISFSEIVREYPPDQFNMFIAIGYQDSNKLREAKCKEAIGMGYKLVSIIGSKSQIPSNVVIGWNCFVMPQALIHPCVNIKNNVFVWSGALIGHHSTIDDNCWLTSCCNIAGNVQLGANTFVAINATIGHSVKIGTNCFLGANTLVTKDLDNDKVVIEESTKPIKLNSQQFIRFTNFSSL